MASNYSLMSFKTQRVALKHNWIVLITHSHCWFRGLQKGVALCKWIWSLYSRPAVLPFLFPSTLGCEGRTPILQGPLKTSQWKHKKMEGGEKSLQGQNWNHGGAESRLCQGSPRAISSLLCSCPFVTGWQQSLMLCLCWDLPSFKEKKITVEKVVNMKMWHYFLKISDCHCHRSIYFSGKENNQLSQCFLPRFLGWGNHGITFFPPFLAW